MHSSRVLFATVTSDRITEFLSLPHSRYLVSQTPQDIAISHVRLSKKPLPVRTYVRTYVQLVPEPTMATLAWPPALAAVHRYPFTPSLFTTDESEAYQP